MYRNRLFVICNVIINRVIIVRANINILNREIESPFSNNPKKKKKKKRTSTKHLQCQILQIYDTFQANSSWSVNRIRSQRVSKLSYLGIIIRWGGGGGGISSCWPVKVR